jgi:small basic protein
MPYRLTLAVGIVLTLVCKIVKSDYYLLYVCLSVCLSLSVRIEQLGSYWKYFRDILFLSIFRKYAAKAQISLKSDNYNVYFT